MPYGKEDANLVRFTVGSSPFFLNIDQLRNGSILPAECWRCNLTGGTFFLAAPAEMFEKGRIYWSLDSRLPVRRFFGEMRSRRSENA